jgi:hypothetical protein
MDFIDQIKALGKRIPELKPNIQTEEAAKNALVLPMINILGYNVFDPSEVLPEYIADHGIKKGEKVDFAIFKDGKPSILIECKSIDNPLTDTPASQLYRYFSVTNVRVGILTNGIVYRFFSDLDAPNKMDAKPFLEINLEDIKEPSINELKRFSKDSFDLDDLTSAAAELKYTKEIKQRMATELTSPSEEFVRFFAKQVYNGMFNKNARDMFTPITKNALNQFINDKINDRLKSAMTKEESEIKKEEPEDLEAEPTQEIITTEDEKEAYYIIKAILCDLVDPSSVIMRDAKSYCPIFLKNQRHPICRLYFDGQQKYMALVDLESQEKDTKFEKVPITDLNEIYSYSDRLKNIMKGYLNQSPI